MIGNPDGLAKPETLKSDRNEYSYRPIDNKDPPPLPNSGRFLGVNKDPPPNSESGKTSVNEDPLAGPPQDKILRILEVVKLIF